MTAATSLLDGICGTLLEVLHEDDEEPGCAYCRPWCDGHSTLEWHVPEGSFRGHYRPRKKCRKALPDLRQQRCRERRAP